MATHVPADPEGPCPQDEDIIATWRAHGIPNDQSTRDAAARIVLKLADDRDYWRDLAMSFIDSD